MKLLQIRVMRNVFYTMIYVTPSFALVNKEHLTIDRVGAPLFILEPGPFSLPLILDPSS